MKIVYFAWFRERVGLDEETVELPAEVITIDNLLGWLKTRGENYEAMLQQPEIVRVAVDRKHISEGGTDITGANEIALFPPMTGG